MNGVAEKNRSWLGWCPNHPAPAMAPKTGMEIYLILMIGILVLPAAALVLPSYTPHDVAVWVFSMDKTGAKEFVTRLPATEDGHGRLSFPAGSSGTHPLPAGNYWLVIEQPAGDGSYRFALNGPWVTGPSLDPSHKTMKFFTVAGGGSLSGEDAYEALMAAYNGGEYVTGVTTLPDRSGVSEREYTVGL